MKKYTIYISQIYEFRDTIETSAKRRHWPWNSFAVIGTTRSTTRMKRQSLSWMPRRPRPGRMCKSLRQSARPQQPGQEMPRPSPGKKRGCLTKKA